jgi:hypothetical protein
MNPHLRFAIHFTKTVFVILKILEVMCTFMNFYINSHQGYLITMKSKIIYVFQIICEPFSFH